MRPGARGPWRPGRGGAGRGGGCAQLAERRMGGGFGPGARRLGAWGGGPATGALARRGSPQPSRPPVTADNKGKLRLTVGKCAADIGATAGERHDH